jgi:CDP-diacylglycerol---glycerol-3-phosphate 3-phosphatidyltransferase
LRSIAATEGYTIKAGELGKSKMMMQVVGVTLVMLSVRWPDLRAYAMTAMWAVVVFALASAFDYFRKFWRKVDTSIKLRGRRELIQMERQKRRLERIARLQKSAETRRLHEAGGETPESIRH